MFLPVTGTSSSSLPTFPRRIESSDWCHRSITGCGFFSCRNHVIVCWSGNGRGGGNFFGFLRLFFFAFLQLFDITMEKEIHGNIPVRISTNGSTQTENFTRQQPVHQTDGVFTLVVGGNSNIDILERGVGITEGNNGKVDIRSLTNGLRVGS